MVTDLAEVYRLGTAKAEENVDFRRYLSARHHPEEQFQILATEIQKHIDCTLCANCCRHSEVTVSAEEIAAIANELGVAAEEVERLYTRPDPDAQTLRILNNEPGGCVFLSGNLCLIYESRPRACREFPHVAPGEHSLGSRPSSIDRWVPLCPILYNAVEAHKHLTGYPQPAK